MGPKSSTSNTLTQAARGYVLGGSAALGAMACGGLALLHTDSFLIGGLETALASRTQVAADTAVGRDEIDPRALRLSRHETGANHGLSHSVALGDRISISSADGQTEVLEVVSVDELPVEATRVAGTAEAQRLLMVTSRSVGGASPRVVRLIIEAEAPAQSPARERQPRTL